MIRAPLALLALAGLPAAAPAAAQEGLRFDAAPLLACLAAAGPGAGDAAKGDGAATDGAARACIGLAAEACMAATEGGWSTIGMVGCVSAEHDWWDADLNTTYRDLRARERQGDADWPQTPGILPRPSGADALRDMQRAWIAWRDATCLYEELDWWGGTGAALIGASCRLQLTAEQALRLRGYLARD